MAWQAMYGNPFFTVALPLILTFVFAAWFSTRSQNSRVDELGKRVDELGKRLDDLRIEMHRGFDQIERRFEQIESRLERIEAKLENHGECIAMLEGPGLVRARQTGVVSQLRIDNVQGTDEQ